MTLPLPLLLRGAFPSTSNQCVPGFPYANGLRVRPPMLVYSGVTKDENSAVVGGCTVSLFRTLDDVLVDRVISDAVTGAFTFTTTGLAEQYYLVLYKDGTPALGGTTVNTLVGT